MLKKYVICGNDMQVIAAQNEPVRWTSPLGLPIVQPYVKSERHLVCFFHIYF